MPSDKRIEDVLTDAEIEAQYARGVPWRVNLIDENRTHFLHSIRRILHLAAERFGVSGRRVEGYADESIPGATPFFRIGLHNCPSICHRAVLFISDPPKPQAESTHLRPEVGNSLWRGRRIESMNRTEIAEALYEQAQMYRDVLRGEEDGK